MEARRVHALMAAGLADPELLARWRREPGLLRDAGLDPGAIDLDGLWKFAGLSEKIRYNPCREHLPLAFRLLGKAGLEIEVFASYAGRAAELRKAGKASVEDKIQGLVEFVERWHDPSIDAHAQLWDLLRHEDTIARMRRRMAGGAATLPAGMPGATSNVSGTAAPDSVPVVAGVLELRQMSFDPRILTERLRRQSPELSDLTRGTLHLGYWWNGDALAIIDLDELGFCVLSAVDGAATVAELAAALAHAGVRLPLAALLGVFDELAGAGLVRFRSGPDA
jgi:hypothetical protein